MMACRKIQSMSFRLPVMEYTVLPFPHMPGSVHLSLPGLDQVAMDKKDLISYFIYLKNNYLMNEIETKLIDENSDINKLDIQRLYKYIDKLYTVDDVSIK